MRPPIFVCSDGEDHRDATGAIRSTFISIKLLSFLCQSMVPWRNLDGELEEEEELLGEGKG
jgi:hypothetical protein